MNINEAIDAYIDCGRKKGWTIADQILCIFQPENKYVPKVKDIPYSKRNALVSALIQGKSFLEKRTKEIENEKRRKTQIK